LQTVQCKIAKIAKIADPLQFFSADHFFIPTQKKIGQLFRRKKAADVDGWPTLECATFSLMTSSYSILDVRV
jgi:hypothetical protein